jgi:hypothetical protein
VREEKRKEKERKGEREEREEKEKGEDCDDNDCDDASGLVSSSFFSSMCIFSISRTGFVVQRHGDGISDGMADSNTHQCMGNWSD